MSGYNTAQPYLASFVILKKDGKVAFVLRSNTSYMNGYYGLPSGKVEKNESFTAAAIREAKEETGVDISLQDLSCVHTQHRNEDLDWVDAYFEASEYSGEVINAEPHLHGELAWFALDNLPENIVPATKFVLERIAEGKSYSQYGWTS